MNATQLRRELGHMILRLDELVQQAWEDARANGFPDDACATASYLGFAADNLRTVNHKAGKLLVAQLTDKDRAQADEAAGRA